MIRFSVGVGKRTGRAEREALAADFNDFLSQVELLTGDDVWWSPHVWKGLRRSQDNWLCSSLIAIDVDHHAVGAEGKDEHAPMPLALRQGIIDAWNGGALAGNAIHMTPRGMRVLVALPRECSSASLYRAAAMGASQVVERALRALFPKTDLRIDPASWDTARYLWAPNARVDGAPREAKWIVSADNLIREADDWAGEAASPLTDGREDKREVDREFGVARDRWLADHPLPAVDERRTCPACKHEGCWGPMPKEPRKWWCWSANHGADSGGCGRSASSGRGWFGDALDLAASERGINPVEVLRRDGYLITADPRKPDVLLPGAHATGEGTVERSVGEFADEVLSRLPRGAAFRRGITVVGLDLNAGVMRAHNATSIVQVAEKHVRPVRWFKSKDHGEFVGYSPMSKAHGSDLLNIAEFTTLLPRVEAVATYPTYARLEDGSIVRVRDGYNDDSMVYLVADQAIAGIVGEGTMDEARTALADLLVDFPFADDASMENVVLLLLTLMMRPACDIVPLFHVGAPLERTGKTKMLRECVGTLITGRYAPVITFTESEEETRKRLDALVLEGQPFAVFDNVPIGVALNSASMAAVITSSTLKFRVLGKSEVQEARNSLTIATTGNNSRFSAELVKRTVPITLIPRDDKPEKRSDFRHPDIAQYALDGRRKILSMLVGAIERWMAAGRPAPQRMPRIGGFERWWQTVCGVAEHGLGLCYALENRDEFTRQSGDGVGDDATALIAWWLEQHGEDSTLKYATIYEAANSQDLFSGVIDGNDASRRSQSFQKKVLAGILCRRPVGGHTVVSFSPGHWTLRRIEKP